MIATKIQACFYGASKLTLFFTGVIEMIEIIFFMYDYIYLVAQLS